MRPIDKGQAPRTYDRYQDAGPDLINVIGDYCSYCERQIETDLAVEHIQPKSQGGPLTDWKNFLLGCKNCNSRKGKSRVNLSDYLWPDTDNTFLAFEYLQGGIVRARTKGTSPSLQAKAEKMIKLVGLDVDPGNPSKARRPKDLRDRRWLRRQQVWQLAESMTHVLSEEDTARVRELIVELALARGLFSIWMTVFSHDLDMKLRLIVAFRGTALDCFDPKTARPVPRQGGQC